MIFSPLVLSFSHQRLRQPSNTGWLFYNCGKRDKALGPYWQVEVQE